MSRANRGIGFASIATCVGDRLVTPAEVAEQIGAEASVVNRWIGDLSVHGSALSDCELGAEAARRCLAGANVSPEDVDVIIWGSTAPYDREMGRRELHVQRLIGATNATAIELGMPCSESITALRLARSLLRDDAKLQRILIVFGEKRETDRTLGFDVVTYQPVFSDAGAAALITRDSAWEILGFGEASNGDYWDFLKKIRSRPRNPPKKAAATEIVIDPERAKLAVDGARLHTRALNACLAAAGMTRDEIDVVLLTREGPRIPQAIMRQLDIAPEKLFAPPRGATHVGMGDYLLHLSSMLEAGLIGKANQVFLLGSRAVGTIRFCVMRHDVGQPSLT